MSRTLRAASRTALVAAGMLMASLIAGGCQSKPPANIVLITIDTLRADRIGPYGYSAAATPNLTKFAERGIVFERAYANTSWTLPSLSSVMSGRYPSAHGVRTWNDTLADSEVTIAELLREKGYLTAAIVGSYPLDRAFGLGQGFAHYDDEMTNAMIEATDSAPLGEVDHSDRQKWLLHREVGAAFRPDAEVSERAIEWLRRNQDSPFFLWAHYFGPHERGKRLDLDSDERAAHVAAQIERYDGDVEVADQAVGRLLDALRSDPRWARTLVIVHSDHGQALQEHGLFGHGFELYETTVRVPLIVRLPNDRRAGDRVGALVRNLDIFATIARAAGVRLPSDTVAVDLLAARPVEGNHVYLETYHLLGLTAKKTDVGGVERRVGRILRGIRTRDNKLIRHQPMLAASDGVPAPLDPGYVSKHTQEKVYDLVQDPGERRGVAKSRKPEHSELEALLSRYVEAEPSSAGERQLDEEAIERLRSLGYQP